MFQRTLLVAALAASASLSAHADDAATTLQPTVQVTASRVAETVDQTLADVSVITRADIDASAAPDLIDLLRLQAGVDVARSGGAGGQTSVFLRGTNSNHVLVLIDGVRVASANTGGFAFENLPLEAVERVEIVRGPRAGYWGSDAVGGVIQIITRRLDGPHLAVSGGSYDSAAGSVGYGVRSASGGFSILAGGRHVGGFSATNPAAGPYLYNPDDNGFQNHNIVAQGDYALGSQHVSGSVLRSEGSLSFDNGDPGHGFSRTLDQAVGVNLEGPLSDSWQQRLSLGTNRENIDTAAFGTAFRSTREQLSWTNDIRVTDAQQLTAGLDYVHDDGRSLDTFAGTTTYAQSRNDAGVFGGWRLDGGVIDGEASARYDHNDAFGSAVSGSAAAGWNLAQDLRLSASYGTAFRAPTLNELYSPGYAGSYAGNPALDPERSRTAEIALTWRPDAHNEFNGKVFSTRIHDLIDFTGPLSQAINVDNAAIDGVELTHALRIDACSWTNTLTLQNPRNADTDAQLLRRPKRKLASVLQTALSEQLSAGVEVVASGRSEDIGAVTLGGYSIVNLRAGYILSPAWRLGARIENLFDHDYQLLNGYNTPGVSGYLTVTYMP